MIVEDVRIDERNGTAELSARIRKSRLAPDGERAWFRFPAKFHPPELDASPYLPGLLVACMSLREPLIIDGPVSARLLDSAEQAKEIYRSWKSKFADVRVEAARHELSPGAAPRAACFFTRGVDSWYTALNGMNGGATALDVPITTLIYCPTADFFVGNPTEHEQRTLRAASAALIREAGEQIGCEPVAVDSNLRELVEPHCKYEHSHGGLLASTALALGSHLTRVHMASTLKVGHVVGLGSHPHLDPLWSTERTEFVHDGAEVSRVEKLRFLANHPVALERLKVCIDVSADGNCGRCGKCLRTMIGLRVAGAPEGERFDAPLRLHSVLRLRTRYDLERAMYHELLEDVERADGHHALRAAVRAAGVKGWLQARANQARWRAYARAQRARGRLLGTG